MEAEAGPGPVPSGSEPADLAADLAAGMAAELDRIEAELDGVDQALARLDAGSYGTCERCDARLDPSVLAGTPTARRCPAHL